MEILLNIERKILIFDLGRGIFDVSIIKIKGNEYNILGSLGEEYLGGEDFNQLIIKYVMEEIEKDNRFENINLKNRNEKNIFILNYINIETEKVKIDL